MKEATGELNMTVITVVAIAAVAAFFYAIVWPAVKGNITSATKCSAATCSSCTVSGGKRTCTSCSADLDGDGRISGSGETGFQCVFKEK